MYLSMIRRCVDEKDPHYKYYGDRGIKVCEEWLDKEKGFVNYYNCIVERGWKEGLSVDRIDNNGNHEPNNVRCVNYHVQNANRRVSKLNTSGYSGIWFHRTVGESYITINRKRIYLGGYKNKKDAVDARNKYIINNNLSEYAVQEWKG